MSEVKEVSELRVLFFSPSEDDTLGAWFDRWIPNDDRNYFMREINRIRREQFVEYSVTNETRLRHVQQLG